jgi:hypothetical protein
LEKELHNAPDKVKFLEGRVEQFTSLINWTRQLLLKADDTSLRAKFLHIFYSGYLAYQYGNDKVLTNRRKYTELYLYSQGLLLAEHISELQKKLEKSNSNTDTHLLSLPLKIVLLHELGIINSLKARYEKNNAAGYNHQLAKLVCLLTSESPKNYSSVLSLITSLESGTSSDLLTSVNRHSIKKVLENIHL